MGNLMQKKREEINNLINLPAFKKRLLSLFENDEKKANKFKATLLNVSLSPQLASASPTSIIKAALAIAETGLNLATATGQAYLVKYGKDVVPVIGYKGWQKLAEEAGKLVNAHPVFDCDRFQYTVTGFTESFILEPDYDKREEDNPKWVEEHLKGVVVCLKDMNTGIETNKFVSKKKIKQLASKSPAKDSKYSPYKEWLLEMYMAKAIKYVLSKTAMPERVAQAVEIENQTEIEEVKEELDLGVEIIEAEPIEEEKKQKGILE